MKLVVYCAPLISAPILPCSITMMNLNYTIIHHEYGPEEGKDINNLDVPVSGQKYSYIEINALNNQDLQRLESHLGNNCLDYMWQKYSVFSANIHP